jgi:hypothetical protein
MKKVLIGTVEIAGFFGNLATGLRQNGYDVTEVFWTEHQFKYSRDQSKTPFLFKVARKYKALLYGQSTQLKFQKLVYYFLYHSSIRLFLIQSLFQYKVFVFGFGISLFENDQDLKWLRRFGKTVISNVAMGSEARPPYIDGARRNPDGSLLAPELLIELSKTMKDKLERIEKYSSIIIGAPLTSQFLEKPFINLFELGLPYPEKKVLTKNNITFDPDSPIKILHSPSHPFAKGSDVIQRAIESLIQKGYSIQFIELSNKSNSEILEAISTSDIVVDQAYSDTAMATFATEASFYGKPVVVGGYGWDELKKYIPTSLFPTSQTCSPEEIEATIEKLLIDSNFRIAAGKEARKFVSVNWESKIVGKKFSALIENKIPDEWFIDPLDILYTHGVGVNEKDLKLSLKSLLAIGGESALLLGNKRKLKEKFIEFAAN